MSPQPKRSPGDLIARLDDLQGCDRAVQEAVRHAVIEHLRADLPMADLVDGQVVWIAPENLPVPPGSD